MPIHIFSLITLHNPELYTYLDNHTQRPQPHSDSADEIYNSQIKIFVEPKSDQQSAQTSSGSVMYSTVSRLSWSWCASTERSHAGTELGGPLFCPSQDSVMATGDHGGEDVRSRKQGRREAEQRESSFGGCCPAAHISEQKLGSFHPIKAIGKKKMAHVPV